MFLSLDFLYVPSRDVRVGCEFYVNVLGATLLWRIRDGSTTVAALRLTGAGPQFLLADHLEGDRPIFIYQVAQLDETMAALHQRGWTAEAGPFELPHGPCATFRDPDGNRLAIYELRRPEADAHFAGRVDE